MFSMNKQELRGYDELFSGHLDPFYIVYSIDIYIEKLGSAGGKCCPHF